MYSIPSSISSSGAHRAYRENLKPDEKNGDTLWLKCKEWADAAPAGSGEARDIALARIEHCHQYNVAELDFTDLNLTSLPEALPSVIKTVLLKADVLAALPVNLSTDIALKGVSEADKTLDYIREKLPLPETIKTLLDKYSDNPEIIIRSQPGLKALLEDENGLLRLEKHLQHYDAVVKDLAEAVRKRDVFAIKDIVHSPQNNALINPFRLVSVCKDDAGKIVLVCSKSPHGEYKVHSGADRLHSNIREGSLPGDVILCQTTTPKHLCFDKQKIILNGIEFFLPSDKKTAPSHIINELIDKHKERLLRTCQSNLIKENAEYQQIVKTNKREIAGLQKKIKALQAQLARLKKTMVADENSKQQLKNIQSEIDKLQIATRKRNNEIDQQKSRVLEQFPQLIKQRYPELAESADDNEAIKDFLYNKENYPDYEHLHAEAKEYIKLSTVSSHIHNSKKNSRLSEEPPELEMINYLGRAQTATVVQHNGELRLRFFGAKAEPLPFKPVAGMVLRPGSVVSATLIKNNATSDIAEIHENLNFTIDEPFSLHKLMAARENIRIDNPSESLVPPAQSIQDRYAAERVDLRHLPFVTIDGARTAIIDDALYAERLKNGAYDLYVAIASTAALIEPNSQLEQEARSRGQNIYLPGMVSTMLPNQISRQLGTLSPQEDKAALVCKMTIDSQGHLDKESIQFMHATVRSQAKLDYDTVSAHLAEGDRLSGKTGETCALLNEIAQKRHAVIGDTPYFSRNNDYYFNVDENSGKLISVSESARGSANDLVQDLMITANIAAGAWLGEKQQSQGIYRTHIGFSHQKELKTVLDSEKVFLKNNIDSTEGFREVLTALESNKLSASGKNRILSWLTSANYSHQPQPHLGIGTNFYLPWTSPLRRYADLVNHEIVSEKIKHTAQESVPAENSAREAWLNQVINPVFTRQLAQQQGKVKSLQKSVERALVLDLIKRQLDENNPLLSQALIKETIKQGLYKVELPEYRINTLMNSTEDFKPDQQLKVKVTKVEADDRRRPLVVSLVMPE
ncbi:VacB/RNase II family 3'-5' exoribonuclease [Pantoea alhagi]|uniref:RNB domain-containing ribonuclease n=1 Tax=Mixta sp. BE291 TaxID=3158787 RepID=UPI00285D940A|nr:VacB/RNase II family 3'-5' exoribonuclease [Pantoea alhagi]